MESSTVSSLASRFPEPGIPDPYSIFTTSIYEHLYKGNPCWFPKDGQGGRTQTQSDWWSRCADIARIYFGTQLSTRGKTKGLPKKTPEKMHVSMVDTIVLEWLKSDNMSHKELSREILASGLALLTGWLEWLNEIGNRDQMAGKMWGR